MAPSTQAKILRARQEREFEPLGCTISIKTDTRIIATTNKKLDEEIKESSLNLSAGRSLKEVEKEMILRTLEETGAKRSHAANTLVISRRTLQLKLKEYVVNPQ